MRRACERDCFGFARQLRSCDRLIASLILTLIRLLLLRCGCNHGRNAVSKSWSSRSECWSSRSRRYDNASTATAERKQQQYSFSHSSQRNTSSSNVKRTAYSYTCAATATSSASCADTSTRSSGTTSAHVATEFESDCMYLLRHSLLFTVSLLPLHYPLPSHDGCSVL